MLESMNRFMEPPLTGSFCDLLWADPLLEDVLGYKLSDRDYIDVSKICNYYIFTVLAYKQFVQKLMSLPIGLVRRLAIVKATRVLFDQCRIRKVGVALRTSL